MYVNLQTEAPVEALLINLGRCQLFLTEYYNGGIHYLMDSLMCKDDFLYITGKGYFVYCSQVA